MAKRGADKDLTQDNWDVEDEEEEVGSCVRYFFLLLWFNIGQVWFRGCCMRVIVISCLRANTPIRYAVEQS